MNTTGIVNKLTHLYNNGEFVTDKTGCQTVEILNASFIADKPFLLRAPNEDYVRRELKWYRSQSLNVNSIEGKVPEIWKQVASDNGYINSNYGWCIYSKDNQDQFDNVLDTLINDINSRRAVMIYTRPSMQYDYNSEGKNDFMCTNNVQYLYRNNQLHAIVNMRSNDAVFGYNNDYAWQKYVLGKLTASLSLFYRQPIIAGDIHWNAGSLHVYAQHFKELER
jgi:thymidylate synthase